MKTNSNALKSMSSLGLVALTALCFATAAPAQTSHSASMPMEGMQKGEMHNASKGPNAMKQSMMGGMDSMQKMKMSGDTDKDFAMMMKVHHQGAVEMAQLELDKGKSPEMKAMAKAIIAAQKKEIAQFDQWLAKQK